MKEAARSKEQNMSRSPMYLRMSSKYNPTVLMVELNRHPMLEHKQKELEPQPLVRKDMRCVYACGQR